MDGVVRKDRSQENRYDEGRAVQDQEADFSMNDIDGGYHIFELGKLYRRGQRPSFYDTHDRLCDQIDVRTLLEGKESDYDVLRAYDPSALVKRRSFNRSFFAKNANFTRSKKCKDYGLAQHAKIDFDADGYVRFSVLDLPILGHNATVPPTHASKHFTMIAVGVVLILSTVLFIGTAFAVKNRVETASDRAVASMRGALVSLSENDLASLGENVQTVHEEFSHASDELDKINPVITFVSQYIPGTTKLSSGTHIVEAGKHLSHTASEFSAILPELIDSARSQDAHPGKTLSLLDIYRGFADHLSNARYDVAHAQKDLENVHIDDVPKQHRSALLEVRQMLPEINNALHRATEARPAIEDLLGANGPRTYLLLFQNNQEMRATGGFIGSYGIVKINKGKIEKMFVDDVYNPDGQLIDRIVPPLPIQKISANWSLHDSNWFADFPVSAKKAMDFYERTGGPTVDGVIAMTPNMVEEVLTVTGPIALPEEGLVLNAENFVRIMQDEIEDRNNYVVDNRELEETEVEEQADKKDMIENDVETPKKVLSDLMPILIDRLSKKTDPRGIADLLSILSRGVKERHLLVYTSNKEIQEIIEQSGWSGNVLDTDRDYLSVINTNINGFKTDGMIDENIEHVAQIDAEGYIVNTVKITRTHTGGKTGYPWWDAVNANYMRVYVPKGSQLVDVEGQTREINQERLDYDALGYERDEDVVREESSMQIDEETGTRIYDEYGKTVFANWTYVSPQETVVITYTYRLPFRVKFYEDNGGQFGSYAVIFQKQSGSQRSHIESTIELDKALDSQWHVHDNKDLYMSNDLDVDRYNGVVFRM